MVSLWEEQKGALSPEGEIDDDVGKIIVIDAVFLQRSHVTKKPLRPDVKRHADKRLNNKVAKEQSRFDTQIAEARPTLMKPYTDITPIVNLLLLFLKLSLNEGLAFSYHGVYLTRLGSGKQ